MSTRAWVDISLPAARHNLRIARMAAPASQVMAVIKANGYGHGATHMADALHDSDAFAVARVSEGIELRHHGVSKPIVILSGSHDREDLAACAEYHLQPVLHSLESCQLLKPIPLSQGVWLKVDTGMHRLGMTPAEFAQSIDFLRHISQPITGVMSHLASSEQPGNPSNQIQLDLFQRACQPMAINTRSLANSGGILLHPQTHLEWVRPGIMLYGSNPGTVETALSRQLQPVMTLKSRVIMLKTLKPGESTGYNGIWTASRQSTIATVAIGYADGYPRHAPNGTPVLINGQYWPLAGRVSMDLITVDVTGSNVKAGDEVTLWGEGLAANLVAGHAQTISYDLFTGVTERVKRIYNQ